MPTMNRIDMLNCAAGHHDFSDDASECHVCGHSQAEASAPADPVRDAAPVMLAALKECLPLFDMVTALDDHGSNALGQAENLIRAAIAKAEGAAEWSGSPCPVDPDNFWIDDATGERVNAHTGERSAPQSAEGAA